MRHLTDISNEDRLFMSEVVGFNTLIVCIGNTCRSVILHSLLEHNKKSNHNYFSAGIFVKEKEILDNTKRVLFENAINPCKVIPQSIQDSKFNFTFDRVVILDKSIKIEDLSGISYKKLTRYDISDPEGEDLSFYQNTFSELLKCFDDLLSN